MKSQCPNSRFRPLAGLLIVLAFTVLAGVTAASESNPEIVVAKPAITLVPATLATITTSVSSCPTGCECMSAVTAAAKFGENGWSRCSEDICGYETADAAAKAANTQIVFGDVPPQVPKYCMKQGTPPAPVCPDSCYCMLPEYGKAKGLGYCNNVEKICGYQYFTQTATAAGTSTPMYCFGTPVMPTPVCQDGCTCISESAAKEMGYSPPTVGN